MQVGSVGTVTALHTSGDDNVFKLNGNWGQGLHSVQIQFTNDLYGGTPT